ncbi:MAG: histidine kinase [Thiobacillus sp.]|nr:histidine kinase [Thiobacillus sp.]
MIDSLYHLTEASDVLANLLRAWRRESSPDMGLLVLVPEAETARIPAIQAACREVGVAMVGAVFPALVTDQGFSSQGVWLLRFDKMPPAFLLANMDGEASQAADAIAKQVSTHLDGAAMPALFLIFDAMLPTIGSILSDLYGKLADRVRYAGVNAGSETFQPMPCLFDNDRVVGGGVLGLLLPDETQVAVSHGYPVTESLMNATSTAGNRIDLINGRPAFDVYRDVILAEFGIELTHANFYDYAAHYPFGLVTTLDVLVRIPVAYSDEGALYCVGEVPPNAKLRLLRAPSLQNSDCVGSIAGKLARLGDLAERPLLTFYCAGRRMHFGADAANELALLKATTGVPAIAGALSLGEIDSMVELDFPRFHNATVVCVA